MRWFPGAAVAFALSFMLAPPARADDEEEEPERDFPYLADEAASGSISVGDASSGFLVAPRRVDEGDTIGILPRQRERNLRYGSEQLVLALQDAARALHAATGARLWLGNVARRAGGDIPWSVSHNSGRDADIAFCYQDAKGEPVDPPDLVALNAEGVSVEHGLRFDAARTWIVVKALLDSPHASVQYLFISGPLETQLLIHAKNTSEPARLIQRAAEVLSQPGNSGAHDDHLHLRVYCSERDKTGGCVDTGVVHPWYRGHEAAKQRRIREVAEFLRDERADQRRNAILRLVLLEARDKFHDLAAGLDDDDAGVRQAAVAAVAAFGDEEHITRLAQLYRRESAVEVRIAIVQAAARVGGKAAGELLAAAVGVPEPELGEVASTLGVWARIGLSTHANPVHGLLALLPLDERSATWPAVWLPSWRLSDIRWLDSLLSAPRLDDAVQLAAIDAAARGERLEPALNLVALLADSSEDVRVAAARALSFITNVHFVANWLDAPAAERDLAAKRWRMTVLRSPSAPRDAWLVTGFRGAGYDVRGLHPKFAWELVRATSAADHLSFNAQRTLMRLFDHRPASLSWKKQDACLHWLRWMMARRHSYQLAAPTSDLARACSDARD